MRKPPKHRPDKPTTCDISDLLNEIHAFVTENPLWYEDEDSLVKMGYALAALKAISQPEDVTQEEFEFSITLFNTFNESVRNNNE
jgi:hypothetical protein